MPHAQRFSINADRVVHETIDGETIIIQLETGTYFSLAGAGAEIWAMLAAGRSTREVVDELQRCYEGSAEEFGEATTGLVRELQREGLLEKSPGEIEREASTNGAPSSGAVGADSNGPRVPFDSPKLQKYTDMQYFLMLDPIHEVDGIGWPNPPSERPGR
jgi:hypothetical protein